MYTSKSHVVFQDEEYTKFLSNTILMHTLLLYIALLVIFVHTVAPALSDPPNMSMDTLLYLWNITFTYMAFGLLPACGHVDQGPQYLSIPASKHFHIFCSYLSIKLLSL